MTIVPKVASEARRPGRCAAIASGKEDYLRRLRRTANRLSGNAGSSVTGRFQLPAPAA
jgi:hypothetical protein